MQSPRTRRRTLRWTGAALLTGLAGCSGLLGGASGGADPDAGTDSYGVLARNEMDQPRTVTVTALTLDGETLLDETVDLEPGGEREWDSVLAGSGQQQVKAQIDDGDPESFERDSAYVNVGGAGAPAVPNVVVRVHQIDEFDVSEPHPEVTVTLPETTDA